MKVNSGSIGCQSCSYREHDKIFGYICQHKASMESIEVEKEFYKIGEVKECDFYDYDGNSVFER